MGLKRYSVKGGIELLFYVFIFIFLVIYIGLALLVVVNPYLVWKITESWKARTQPPKIYFNLMRLGGILGIVLGVYLLIQLIP